MDHHSTRLTTPQLAAPDLTFSIRPAPPRTSPDAPYDFSRFVAARAPSEDPGPAVPAPYRRTHRRVWSAGSAVARAAARHDEERVPSSGGGAGPERGAIWCMDCCDGLLALGCSDGAIELWDAATGALKVSGGPVQQGDWSV